MNRFSLIFALTLMATVGCEKGNLPINQDRIRGPAEKPSAECKAADTGVHQILLGQKDFRSTNWLVLGDGSCVVKVNLGGHANILALVKRLKERAGFYTHVLVGKTPVGVWWDEPAFRFPLIKDTDGKAISNLPTDQECNLGAEYLAQTFARAHFEVKKISKNGSETLRCYVQGTFVDEASFESFLAWTNPRSLKGELLHMNFARKNGSTATVWIRAISGL